MQNFEALQQKVFSIQTENNFAECALELFNYQFNNNIVYQQYAQFLNKTPKQVNCLEQIPFLPIEFFKTHKVTCFNQNATNFFASSGTTGANTSKHYILDYSVYEKSFFKAFELFWGSPKDYVIIALLPNYLEQQHSSLIYMISKLIEATENEKSKFCKTVGNKLASEIKELNNGSKKLMLFGVTYSLLDLIEREKFNLNNTIVFETGGMKGRRKEMVRQELHSVLCNGFGISKIASEYGMTELFSQAYSFGDGIFQTPPWMRICIRETNDPLSVAKTGETGGISVIDLANIHSCSFIATSDLGKQYADRSFEVLGRFDNTDIRGCNLLYQE